LDDNYNIEANGNYGENLSYNDVECLFGAVTTYHLSLNPSANGIGLSEPTTSPSVVITEWDQDTGEFSVSATDAEYATFEYYHVCRDAEGNILFASAPATVYLFVNTPTPTPTQTPTPTPTVTPTPTPTTP
jgi:hypothetical protein